MKPLQDLAVGVRLAVGGSRTLRAGLLRLTLTAIGIGLSTAVLLGVAALLSALADRTDRTAAREASDQPGGGAAVHVHTDRSYVDGEQITVTYLEPEGPGAPVPPGLAALPEPGELVVSPALATRFAEQPALRERFAGEVTGTVSPEGLAGPAELWAYAGANGLRSSPDASPVHHFGVPSSWSDLSPLVLFTAGLGVVVLVVPLLVFVAASSRIAGAEREARLSAIRLAGAGAGQIRRIASAEALVGAVAGTALGGLLFVLARPLLAQLRVGDTTVYPADVVPSWPLAVVVLLLGPVLALGSAWLGLRGLVVEPLGVTRRTRPVRRRGWWRLLLVLLGVLMLLPDLVFGTGKRPGEVLPFLLLGAALLLVGVPVLMPWLTERLVDRLHGGSPAWQLAIRRLQLDSGTPSRVVAGVVAVLAGVVAMQTIVTSASAEAGRRDTERADRALATVEVTAPVAGDALARVRAVPGVEQADPWQLIDLDTDQAGPAMLLVAPCPALERGFRLPACADGDVFTVGGQTPPGSTHRTISYVGDGPAEGPRFTVPGDARAATLHTGHDRTESYATVLATPGAARGLPGPGVRPTLRVWLDPGDAHALDEVRAALAPLGWRASVSSEAELAAPSEDDGLAVMRGILYGGAGLTLLLAAVSLLVLAAGQISERRRPLAAMSAAGVPRSVLARSLLWQNTVPMVLGVLVATGAGLGVAALFARIIGEGAPMVVNGVFVGSLAAGAVLLVLGVTAAMLPGLRSATRLEALRAE